MQRPTSQTRAARRAERRRAGRRRQALALAAFGVLVVVLAGIAFVATRGGGDATTAARATTTDPGQERFAEAPGDDVDFEALGRSKFISVMVPGDEGIEAYSLTSEAPEYARLLELLPGREIDLNVGHEVDATIVFVDDARSTVSFELDLSEHVLVRNGRAWEVEPAIGDLVRSLSSRPS